VSDTASIDVATAGDLIAEKMDAMDAIEEKQEPSIEASDEESQP